MLDPKLASDIDQLSAFNRDLVVPLLDDFYRECYRKSFTKDQSFQLTLKLMDSIHRDSQIEEE